jgi:hypothetical protein
MKIPVMDNSFNQACFIKQFLKHTTSFPGKILNSLMFPKGQFEKEKHCTLMKLSRHYDSCVNCIKLIQ